MGFLGFLLTRKHILERLRRLRPLRRPRPRNRKHILRRPPFPRLSFLRSFRNLNRPRLLNLYRRPRPRRLLRLLLRRLFRLLLRRLFRPRRLRRGSSVLC